MVCCPAFVFLLLVESFGCCCEERKKARIVKRAATEVGRIGVRVNGVRAKEGRREVEEGRLPTQQQLQN